MISALANRSSKVTAWTAIASLSALSALAGCGGGGGGGGADPAAALAPGAAPETSSPTTSGETTATTPTPTTEEPQAGETPAPTQPPAEPAKPTLYVSTAGSTGGTGSEDQPFSTIAQAISRAPDDSVIVVKAGTYRGTLSLVGNFAKGITVRSEQPYQARLRNTGRVVNAFDAKGIALEGFDIAPDGTTGDTVIHIQGPSTRTQRVTLRDNIIHDSVDNDLVKINERCSQITLQGNMFYNQKGQDEHIDINGVTDSLVEGNVFFNEDTNDPGTSAFIVMKDSSGYETMDRCTIRGNVFLNWQGYSTHGFLQFGEDAGRFPGQYEARNVTVENNLFLGTSDNATRGIINFQGVRDVTFRHNTISGHFYTTRSWIRSITYNGSMPNENLQFYNNVFSETNPGAMDWFSESLASATTSHELGSNVYWNGGSAIPTGSVDGSVDVIDPANDPDFVAPAGTNPRLRSPVGENVPKWNADAGRFADESTTIAGVLARLVDLYGTPDVGTPLIDAGDGVHSPGIDILGRPRRGVADVGCVERP